MRRYYLSTLLCLWFSYGGSEPLFGVHTDELEDGEGQLVVPRRVHADGAFMTHTLHYAHDRDHRRQRRSVETEPELHIELPLRDETLHLELT